MIDYEKYRGKCKLFSEELCQQDPTLILVRGWYWDAIWGRQEHWWCKKPDGTIVDPTKDQFPSKGLCLYEEYKGITECEYCGKSLPEEKAYFVDQHVYCSYECYGHDIGF